MVSIYHYEKNPREFHVGEVIHNLNGSDYTVLEKYTDHNLLVLLEGGQYIVAVGCDGYAKSPLGEVATKDNTQIGVEWNHGIYLGWDKDAIDFEMLRLEYGSKQKDETRKQSR